MNTKILNVLFEYWDKEFSEFELFIYRQLHAHSTLKDHRMQSDIVKKIVAEKMWEEPNLFALFYLYRSKRNAKSKHLNQHIINLYIRFLTYPSPRLDFYFKIFNQIHAIKNEPPTSIEKELYQIIVTALEEGIWERELKLTTNEEKIDEDNNKSSEKNNIQLNDLLAYRFNLIAEWFLQRYQIFTAYRIYRLGKIISNSCHKKGANLQSALLPFIVISVLLTLFLADVFVLLGHIGFNLMSGLFTGLLTFVVWLLLQLTIPWKHSILRLFIPRQLGAIVAGYFLLIIVGAEYWDYLVSVIKAANETSPFLMCAIPGTLLLLILLYLYWEVRNQLGFYSREQGIWRHVIPVFIIGLIETMIVGSLFFNFTGKHMKFLFNVHANFLATSKSLNLEQLTFVATYMALTLFVGIFLQIFWQKEPITVSL